MGFCWKRGFETDVNPVWAAGLGIACTELALIAFEESGAGFALNGPAFTEAEIRLMSEASGYLAEFSTAYGNALGSLIREVQHRSLSGDPIVSRKLGD